jgi:hypothetical protein
MTFVHFLLLFEMMLYFSNVFPSCKRCLKFIAEIFQKEDRKSIDDSKLQQQYYCFRYALRCIHVARRMITSLESYDETAISARDKFKNFTPTN